jgi:hypothetical protein
MTSTKYIGMDVHKESISIAVRNDAGKLVMECVIETKANVILDFIRGLRGELHVTFEERTWATWLYDLLKPHVRKLVVCDPRQNRRQGNKNDRIDARELSDRLYMNKLSSVYHGGAGWRGRSEQILLHQVGCEARKSPAGRTYQELRFKWEEKIEEYLATQSFHSLDTGK